MNRSMLTDAGRGLLHLLYPQLCYGCGKPLVGAEDVLCLGCDAELAETGYHHIPDNETALRFAGRVPFIRATTLAYFTADGLLQHLLHGLKYGGRQQIGTWLGQRMGMAIAGAWPADGSNNSLAGGIDIVVPVPLHPKKQAIRGYNQSMLVAQGIGSVLGIPAQDGLLLRTRHTDSQTNKTRAERIDNMANAFALDDPYCLAGKHILLCDDVLTTGATLEACAEAMAATQNIKISIATIGIAVS